MKRLFDIIFSFCGLLIFSPILICIALFIKLDSSGPVFYKGLRVGLNGKLFNMLKFRTMVVDAEKSGISSTSANDDRITSVGKLIRRFKLDELPQLINVLKGEMSLVGPRPEVKKFVDQFSNDEKIILTIRPGITDYASLKFHNEGEILAASGIKDADQAYSQIIRPEKINLQIKYVRESSFATDIKIIFKTIGKILGVNESV